MNKFLEKDALGNWNTIPPVPADKMRNVNCHKFVLYVVNRMPLEEMVSDSQDPKDADLGFTFSEKAQSISNTPFTPVKDLESLYYFASKSCEIGKAYIGQILDADTGNIAHSFVLKRESYRMYTCFDKQGFKYPFSIHNLETILDFVNKDGEKPYQNGKWRFVSI